MLTKDLIVLLNKMLIDDISFLNDLENLSSDEMFVLATLEIDLKALRKTINNRHKRRCEKRKVNSSLRE